MPAMSCVLPSRPAICCPPGCGLRRWISIWTTIRRYVLDAPRDLRDRGLQFWSEVTEAVDLDASGFLLLGEACRIVDRLDRLSGALNGQGRDWLKVGDDIEEIGRGKVSVKVVVDGLLSEARQQQLALKTVLAQLGLGKVAEGKTNEKSALQQWLESRSG